MKAVKSLGSKLFLLQMVIMVTAFAVYAFVSAQEESANTLHNFLETADRISDVIIRSTRSSMLRNQREGVSEIVSTVAREPGIEGIRIYNKRGETIYSTSGTQESSPVDMQAEACFGCHGKSGRPLESLPRESRYRFIDTSSGYRVIGLINPILNEPDCSNAACHAHPPNQRILGVVDVKMSLARADAQVDGRRKAVFTLAAVLIALILSLSGAFVYVLVHIPARKVIRGTREVASGNLDYRLDIKAEDEFGQVADSFNQMTRDLKTARDDSRAWSDSLQKKTEQLERMQAQMLQAEKMVSLGKLSATVAHELNNPMAGILTYAKLVERKIAGSPLPEEDKRSVHEALETISSETTRCGNIVKNMLLFSRQRESRFRLEKLHSVLDSSITLVSHHLQINDVTVVRRYDVSDDSLECDANQLKQAFIAMFINAAEAMPKGGTLTVATEPAIPGHSLRILIGDTGCGIPPDLKASIFDPFFTTKTEGAGVGLGLSVVYGVVQHHGGQISVDSKPGEGTTFSIVLPLIPSCPLEESDSPSSSSDKRGEG